MAMPDSAIKAIKIDDMRHKLGNPQFSKMLLVFLASLIASTFVANAATITTTCVDKINNSTGTSDCPRLVSYCTNAAYKTVMTDQCPKTCGFCSGTATTTKSPCADLINPSTGTSDCPGIVRYCTNPNYLTVMRTQCPKTCGFCTSG